VSGDIAANDPDGAHPPSLRTLTYVSSATGALEQPQLLALLDSARRHNEAADVTGLLLHRGNAFFQILEGPETSVREIYQRICDDDRHDNIELLIDEPTSKRQFPDWRMGFLDIDDLDLSLLPGYSDFLSPDTSSRTLFQEMTRSQRMALMFRDME
jgi:hypothetical protein